jgi:TetR/AcrR family transcriptional repressor of nem operon
MGRPKQFDPDTAVTQAMDVFWSHGYGATTPAELADALGIGKGSLYNTFENKHALFEQALRRYGDQRVAGLTEALRGPGSAKARIGAALERLAMPEHARLLRRGCFAVNTASELGAHDNAATAIVRGVFDRMERALQSAVEDGQRSGEIDAGHDACELASMLLTTIIGMSVIAKTGDRGERLRRVARVVLTML